VVGAVAVAPVPFVGTVPSGAHAAHGIHDANGTNGIVCGKVPKRIIALRPIFGARCLHRLCGAIGRIIGCGGLDLYIVFGVSGCCGLFGLGRIFVGGGTDWAGWAGRLCGGGDWLVRFLRRQGRKGTNEDYGECHWNHWD
jgi:hypothetical protein